MSGAAGPGTEIRPVSPEEFDAYALTAAIPFGAPPHPDDVTSWRARAELDRSLAVLEAGRIVATAGAVSFTLSVPGGTVTPVAGVTAVGVLPTHRRRGLLRALMRRQLDDLRDGGEPVAALWASESIIYGRFGYGPASFAADLEIERPWSAFLQPVEVAGRLRLVEPDEALAAFPAIYERARACRPGMTSRDEAGWRRCVAEDPERHRGGGGPRFLVAYADRGYAAYRVREDWSAAVQNNTLEVEELVAADDEAYAVLWRYLLDVDLVARVRARLRPVDEALPLLLADPRRLRTSVFDALWVRLVRVDDALSVRGYGAEGTLTFALRDAFCPWNAGTWRLEAGTPGEPAGCRRTDDPPDLSLDAADLGAAWLGGLPLSRLARARRVFEHTPGALARGDAMFAAQAAPWCPRVF